MITLDDFAAMAREVNGLTMVSTMRANDTIQSSLVNSGLFLDPDTNQPGFAFITYGRVKLANLRARPQVTVTVQSGWRWAALEGRARLIGPDDPHENIDAERLRVLLREVFTAAGGTHDDWDAYDQAMLEQRRTVVLVDVARTYGN